MKQLPCWGRQTLFDKLVFIQKDAAVNQQHLFEPKVNFSEIDIICLFLVLALPLRGL